MKTELPVGPYMRVRCYLLSKSLLPQKPEKWAKMMSQEDNLVLLSEFLEKGECRVLVVYANQQGQLMPSTSFPNTTKTKVVCACAGELVCMCVYMSLRNSVFWGVYMFWRAGVFGGVLMYHHYYA